MKKLNFLQETTLHTIVLSFFFYNINSTICTYNKKVDIFYQQKCLDVYLFETKKKKEQRVWEYLSEQKLKCFYVSRLLPVD